MVARRCDVVSEDSSWDRKVLAPGVRAHVRTRMLDMFPKFKGGPTGTGSSQMRNLSAETRWRSFTMVYCNDRSYPWTSKELERSFGV